MDCRRRGRESGFESLQGRIRVLETRGRRSDSCEAEEGWGPGGGRGEARGRGKAAGRLLFGQRECSSEENGCACVFTVDLVDIYPSDPARAAIRGGDKDSPCSLHLLHGFFRSAHPSCRCARRCPSRGWPVPCMNPRRFTQARQPASQTRKQCQPSCATDQVCRLNHPRSSRKRV